MININFISFGLRRWNPYPYLLCSEKCCRDNIVYDNLSSEKYLIVVGITVEIDINLLSAKLTKCSKTLKQRVGFCQRIVVSVFDHFVELALKELKSFQPHTVQEMVTFVSHGTDFITKTVSKLFDLLVR